MPLTEAEELELLELEAAAAQSKKVQKDDRGVLATASNVANEINYGVLSMVPGAQPLAAEYLGVGVDRTEGDYPSMGQGALRMIGMGGAATVGMLASPLKVAAGGVESMISQTNLAREGVQSGLKPAVRSFLDNVANTFVTKPVRTTAIEAGASASAGAAGAAVYEMTEGNEAARAGAEVVGGSVFSLAPSALRWAGDVTLLGQVAQRVRAGFTKEASASAKRRARARILRATDEPHEALRRGADADVLEDAPLTLIEKSEDPGLLSLEASVRNETDQLKRETRERFAEINKVIRQQFDEVSEGAPGEAREYLSTLMDERIRIAGARVEERLADLGPKANAETASRLAREELEKAYEAALAQERQLWSAIDPNTPAPLTSTLEKYPEMLAELSEGRVSMARAARDIPAVVKKFLGTLKDGEFVPGDLSQNATLGEIKDLRSEMLDAARRERAKPVPNRKKLRILAQIQDALLDDMSAVDGDDAIATARAYSADLNTRFRQGDVGTILGHAAAGDPAIDPLLTLQRTLDGSKLKGAAAIDDLLAAAEKTGDIEAMRGHISDYLLDEFLRVTTTQGDFKPALARRWLSQKGASLDRIPEVRTLVENAIEAQDVLDVVKATMGRGSKAGAAIVLNSTPGKEIANLRASTNVRQAAGEVFDLLATDPSGRAMAGFRTALVEDLLNTALTGQTDDAGNRIVSGFALQEQLRNPQMSVLLDKFLTHDQRRRLLRISNTAARMERASHSQRTIEPVMDDKEGAIANMVRRFLAAGTARAVGDRLGFGGTVQGPQAFVDWSTRMYRSGLDPAHQLIVDAVTAPDDKLLRAVLYPDGANPKFVAQQAHGWLVATAARFGISIPQQNSDTRS